MSQRIAFFGSSLVSAWWNGAATYYRGIVRALHERGHQVTFFEPDAWDRQAHRDIPDPEWAEVCVYKGLDGLRDALRRARACDVVVKASGVGVFDELLEREVLELQAPSRQVVFWDVDAPATLERMRTQPEDPFRELVPRYDAVLTYGGGPPVVAAYEAFGARRCVPIYNAHDPDTHHPVAPDPRFEAALVFLGNRLPDREERVRRFFFDVAEALPEERFLLGGNGWGDCPLPANVRWLGHVYTRDHNALNCTPRAVLNISRDSMASMGWSPATRVFEAAAAGACLITDAWDGVEAFFAPDREILLAGSGDEVVAHLRSLDSDRCRRIGGAARARALTEHTYAHRVLQVEAVLDGRALPQQAIPAPEAS